MAKKNIHYWALVLTENSIDYHIAQTIDNEGDKRILKLENTFCKSYKLKNKDALDWLIELKEEIWFYHTHVYGSTYSEQAQIRIGTESYGGKVVKNIW